MWSQLTTGWQWSAPRTAGVTAAMLAMSAAMLVLAALAVLAVLPVAWRVVAARPPGLRGPSALFLAGLAVVVIGGRHFGNGWPGTGGHPWAHQGLVPGGVAAFAWASTLSVSSFWAHPAALAAFPAAALAWMVLSPLAVACAMTGAATTVRRAGLSPAVLRFETGLGRAACAAMAVVTAGACAWLAVPLGAFGAGRAPGLFRPGAIDVAGLAVLTLAGRRAPGHDPGQGGRAMTRPASRRTFIRNGFLTAAAVTAAGAAGAELISHGTLPGRAILDKLDGACSVTAPPAPRGPLGPARPPSGADRVRRRRPVPPRSPGAGPGAAARRRDGVRPGVPR
jgi:hypothetical protein